MGRKRLSGLAAIFRVSRSGCSNTTSDSIRTPILSTREALTLTLAEDQVRISIGPFRFSIKTARIGSLKTRVNDASFGREETLLERGSEAIKSITLTMNDISSDPPSELL